MAIKSAYADFMMTFLTKLSLNNNIKKSLAFKINFWYFIKNLMIGQYPNPNIRNLFLGLY